MATYAIGDVQGCYEPLQRLLAHINFDPQLDQLWFAGDLVNRGPQSLEVLRFIKKLGRRAISVLGNHDLHLLAMHYTKLNSRKSDTLNAIFTAPDCDELLNWLRHRPLLHLDQAQNWCMTHAGLPPKWSANTAQQRAHEVEARLTSDDCTPFFENMYGNKPNLWSDELTGFDRLRVIVNSLTRMRFVDDQGRLDLTSKEGLDTAPAGFKPWFEITPRQASTTRLLFGHWAALNGQANAENVFALDTGCVWGGRLTALRLEDQKRFSVAATPA